MSKTFRQRDVTDCGAACLAFLLHHYGQSRPIPEIRRLAGTNQQGTTALGMVDAAKALGLTAKAVKGSAEHLAAVG